jgi:hypothetical protein
VKYESSITSWHYITVKSLVWTARGAITTHRDITRKILGDPPSLIDGVKFYIWMADAPSNVWFVMLVENSIFQDLTKYQHWHRHLTTQFASPAATQADLSWIISMALKSLWEAPHAHYPSCF